MVRANDLSVSRPSPYKWGHRPNFPDVLYGTGGSSSTTLCITPYRIPVFTGSVAMISISEYKHGVSRYNARVPPEVWEAHKLKLKELHEAKLTRQQILDIISPDFGDIKPTYGQLCTKFDKWGFHVYRTTERKETALQKGKKITKTDQAEVDSNLQQAFSPESSNGSTVIPDVGALDLTDKSTPRTIPDFKGTPQSQYLEPTGWSDAIPRAPHSRNISDQGFTPLSGSIYESEPKYDDQVAYQQSIQHDNSQPYWMSGSSLSINSASYGYRSSISDGQSSRTSLYRTTPELNSVEPDDPPTIAARTRRANDALDAVSSYLRSAGQKQDDGEHLVSMASLAAYLFATRSYSSAFRIYHRIYDVMVQDMACDDVSKLGALMRCFQSAVEPFDLEFMQRELHQVLCWNFSDSSLSAFTAQMLQSVETQISEGFNLAQGSVLSTSSITRNLNHLMNKGCNSNYPSTKHLYWRLRLLKHSPFHSGCARLLKYMSELLSWAWAAMAVLKFPNPAVQTSGCLCKDGLYFDFVRMVTTVIMEAAMGFQISQLIKMSTLKETLCDCVMCADLESTFEICPIETFTAIALLTVDRCRLDWTSCHPGGRHQELTPQTILKQQLLPTIDSLLDQVAADIRSQTTIHTSDLYDDFLSCTWSCFETHDLPLKNARFDASAEKVEDMMTTLITEELNKHHPARVSTIEDTNGKMPVFSYGENDELATRITAKRTRSNASSLKPSASNASERSMIRIRKKLKFRTSADYLNSMSSYSSLSSRNSMNRFSYVTGLPELETVMDDEELRAQLPPDLTPDEFRSIQRHDSWSRRSDHFSWVPSRPGSTVSRNTSWRESNVNMAAAGSRPGSLTGGVHKRTSQKEVAPHQQAMHNSMAQQHAIHQQQQSSYPSPQAPHQQQQQLAPQPQIQPQAHHTPSQHAYQIHNQSQFQHNQNQTRAPAPIHQPQSMPTPHLRKSTQMLDANGSQGSVTSQGETTPRPERRSSTKMSSSKESQKGRWSSERRRVDAILAMNP